MLLLGWLPRNQLTEVLAEDVLPQISQICTDVRVRRFSHGIHGIHRSSCRDCSPTDFTEFTELLAEIVLPQISQNSQNFLLSVFSHRFHRSTQIVWVPSRGCTCLKCTNVTRGISILLGWCTSCSGKRQSRAETSAPSEVGRFCEFCAICGSYFAAAEARIPPLLSSAA